MLSLIDTYLSTQWAFDKASVYKWQGIAINKREPVTIRLWKEWMGYRVCLHEFKPSDKWSPMHPHAWAAVFRILDRQYFQKCARFEHFNSDKLILPTSEMVHAGQTILMDNPLQAHAICAPKGALTIMINSLDEYEQTHQQCRRTAGKSLPILGVRQIAGQLEKFRAVID